MGQRDKPKHTEVTSQHKNLTRCHKDLASQHMYLTSGGRNMPPYCSIGQLKSRIYLIKLRVISSSLNIVRVMACVITSKSIIY